MRIGASAIFFCGAGSSGESPKLMKNKFRDHSLSLRKISFLLILFLSFPAIVYAQFDSDLRAIVIAQTLEALVAKTQLPAQYLYSLEQNYFQVRKEERGQVKKEAPDYVFGNKHLTIGMQLGYITGYTAYNFDHNTSELEFPMNNWMVGSNLSLGFKNFSLNAQIWTPLESDAGFDMKDKDWVGGTLVSYTESQAEMDAFICDANLRYDFYRNVLSKNMEGFRLLKGDKIKIGALLGYRFERFDYDLYDLYYEVDLLYGYQGQTLYQGTRVGTYKIENSIPYLGLALDVLREKFGFTMSLKYSFIPTAKDVDNHLLRGLTFYGDYDKDAQAWIGSISGFLNLGKNWRLKLGAERTYISIDGITWEENHDPAWDKDQSTDTGRWIIWSEIEYKF